MAMSKIQTEMEMDFVKLTPEMALNLLEHNTNNRHLSKPLVSVYARDIINGNWSQDVGAPISIDKNGILRNGQHRCAAVVEAGKPINVWICRNVAEDGIYDNNRKRSTADQIMIIRPDIEPVYRSSRVNAIIRTLIQHDFFSGTHCTISPKQIVDYIDTHKKTLDEFFYSMPQSTIPKISLAAVYLSLYLAYIGGVDIKKIQSFYDILSSGMSSSEREYPIIAYRNYLINSAQKNITEGEIARCQYSLKKYLSNSCTKRSVEPKDMIWGFPKSQKA